jgi:hypothetical protein
MSARVTASIAAAAAALAVAAPAAAAPTVHQLVVFRSGSFKQKTVRAKEAHVRVGHKRCAVAAGTPLAALVTSRVAKIGLHDFGSCSSRARDGSGLFVRKLGPDANADQNGWVYKVGHKGGSAGAADPSGPFGHGRLRSGADVLWFYCRMQPSGSCQRTLSLDKVNAQTGGVLVQAGAYNDQGRRIPAVRVTVHVDSATGVTDSSGTVRIAAPAGRHKVWADGGGYVRSFNTTVEVR